MRQWMRMKTPCSRREKTHFFFRAVTSVEKSGSLGKFLDTFGQWRH